MGISFDITCQCGHTFNTDDAQFCGVCCVYDCGCRSFSDDCRCVFEQTLSCPSCSECACHKVERWRQEGKIKYVNDERFNWVHADYFPMKK